MLKLLFLLYGGGKGLGMPYWDGQILWLVDTYYKRREAKNGQFYFPSLRDNCFHSYEIFHPTCGQKRVLNNVLFCCVRSFRQGVFVECLWECQDPLTFNRQDRRIKIL